MNIPLSRPAETAVIVSTHNRPRLLKETIENVLRQSYQNMQVIVSDNGSNPHTAETVSQMQQTDDRIWYMNTSAGGHGATHNRNSALASVPSQTPYTFFLDDDDTFAEQDTLERLVTAMHHTPHESSRGVAFAVGRQIVTVRNMVVGTATAPPTPEYVLDSPHLAFPNKAILWSTPFIRQLRGFDPAYEDSAEDIGLSAKAMHIARQDGWSIGRDDEAGVVYRWNTDASQLSTHEGSTSTRSWTKARGAFLRAFGYAPEPI